MKRNYKYLLGLLPGVLVITGNIMGGWWVASNAIFSLIILGVLEALLPQNKSNDTDENVFFPDAVLYLNVIMQIACLSSMFYSVSNFNYSWMQLIAMAISVGTNTGASSIVVGHELIHRKNKWHQLAGKFLLFTSCNFYFFVDHLRVHHKWVGTHRDHATARYGESVYTFFMRSVIGQTKETVKMEGVRLKNANPFVFMFTHYLIVSVILIIAFCYLLLNLFGWIGPGIFLMQAFVGNFLLEYTNYIEHYGLTRNDNERVTELHAWQSDRIVSRYFLIDLSRHADHHYYASKPYHTLKSYERAPVLPGGYANMFFYAIIPPLWFKVMHKELKKEKFTSASSS